MQVIIAGKNIELTEAIKDYAEKKIVGLDKFFNRIIRANITVGVENRHHQKGDVFVCECKLEIPGNDLFAQKTETTLYKAIDKVRDYLELELKKRKGKLDHQAEKTRKNGRAGKEYSL